MKIIKIQKKLKLMHVFKYCSIKIQDKIKFQKLFETSIYENYGTSETTFISIETKNNKLEKQNYVGKLLSYKNKKKYQTKSNNIITL